MMNTVNSDQEVAVGNIVINFLVPVVLIRSRLAGMCYNAIHMTATEVKPSVTIMPSVYTSDSCDKAIVRTMEIHRSVIVVHVMAAPCTVAVLIRNGTISTLKIVDTVFLAISVLAAPMIYRVVF